MRRFAPYRRLASAAQRVNRHRHPWIRREAVDAYAIPIRDDPPGLRNSLIRSVERDPLPIYLRVEDRNAMAHSIEARLPFLDYRLVSFVMSLPPEWKLRDASNKYVLREAMRNRIPESVRARPEKMGFPTSSARWLANDLHAAARQTIADLCRNDDEFLRGDALLALMDRHKAGDAGHAEVLLRAVQFLLWREAANIG